MQTSKNVADVAEKSQDTIYIKAYSCSCLVHDSRQKHAVCDEKTGKVSRSCWGAQKHSSLAGRSISTTALGWSTATQLSQTFGHELTHTTHGDCFGALQRGSSLCSGCTSHARVFVRFFAAAQIVHMYNINTIQDGHRP